MIIIVFHLCLGYINDDIPIERIEITNHFVTLCFDRVTFDQSSSKMLIKKKILFFESMSVVHHRIKNVKITKLSVSGSQYIDLLSDTSFALCLFREYIQNI